MAKLTVLPELAIIDGFRGKVDFYIYHPTCDPQNRGPGIPVARKWPRSPGHLRAQAVMNQWADFTYAAAAWSLLSQEVQDAYRALAVGSGLSGRDLFTRSYLLGLYRYDHQHDIPPLPLDIGPPPVNREPDTPFGYTFIAKENPADLACTFTTAAVYFNTLCAGLQVGIFIQVAPNTFTTRSHQAIGAAPVGYSEHTVDLPAEPGDFIGYYCTAGYLARWNSGEGYWYFHADKIPCTNQLFTFGANRTPSLHGS